MADHTVEADDTFGKAAACIARVKWTWASLGEKGWNKFDRNGRGASVAEERDIVAT